MRAKTLGVGLAAPAIALPRTQWPQPHKHLQMVDGSPRLPGLRCPCPSPPYSRPHSRCRGPQLQLRSGLRAGERMGIAPEGGRGRAALAVPSTAATCANLRSLRSTEWRGDVALSILLTRT
eukprot:2433320-Prymnesium_polylepis.2